MLETSQLGRYHCCTLQVLQIGFDDGVYTTRCFRAANQVKISPIA